MTRQHKPRNGLIPRDARRVYLHAWASRQLRQEPRACDPASAMYLSMSSMSSHGLLV